MQPEQAKQTCVIISMQQMHDRLQTCWVYKLYSILYYIFQNFWTIGRIIIDRAMNQPITSKDLKGGGAHVLRVIQASRHGRRTHVGHFHVWFAVINVIVFIQPQWIGYINQILPTNPGTWDCTKPVYPSDGLDLHCTGMFNDFSSISNTAFRASTFFVGVSCHHHLHLPASCSPCSCSFEIIPSSTWPAASCSLFPVSRYSILIYRGGWYGGERFSDSSVFSLTQTWLVWKGIRAASHHQTHNMFWWPPRPGFLGVPPAQSEPVGHPITKYTFQYQWVDNCMHAVGDFSI